MRLDAIFKQHFTFEYWTLVANTNGTTEYQFKEERKGMYIPGGSMSMALITDEAMGVPMQVRSLKDRSGKAMFVADGVGYPMYIISAEPQLDPFSNVVAYKHTLRKNLPRDYTDLISFAVSDTG